MNITIVGTPHQVKQLKPNKKNRTPFVSMDVKESKERYRSKKETYVTNMKTKHKFCDFNKIDYSILEWRNSYEKKSFIIDNDDKAVVNTKGLKNRIRKADYLCGIIAKDLKVGQKKKYFFATKEGLKRDSFTITRIS